MDGEELAVGRGAVVCDAARVLVERGRDPGERLEAWRGDVLCLSGPLGEFAKLTVEDGSNGTGRTQEALTIAQSALATHEAASGPNHSWTKDSASLTADALDALGRVDEANALRERYGLAGS
jgi:hypothetical protein